MRCFGHALLLALAVATDAWAGEPEATSDIVQYEPGERVTPAVVLLVAPEYPESFKERRAAGYLDVAFQLTESGQPIAPAVVLTELPEAFSQAAVQAIALSRFKYEAFDGHCNKLAPGERTYTLRMWFEQEGDKPRIDIAQPKRSSLRSVRKLHEEPIDVSARFHRRLTPTCSIARLFVTPAGDVANVEIVAAHPDHAFDLDIAHGLRKWRFEMVSDKARRDGARIDVQVVILWR